MFISRCFVREKRSHTVGRGPRIAECAELRCAGETSHIVGRGLCAPPLSEPGFSGLVDL